MCRFVKDAEYNSLLTEAVGHELKSVRSKIHLWFSINMTNHGGEAERLGGNNKTYLVCYIKTSCASTRGAEGQLTP